MLREFAHGFPRQRRTIGRESGSLIMSKPPKKLKGQPAIDARGNPTWKWAGENETVETDLVRALGEGLSLEPASGQANRGLS